MEKGSRGARTGRSGGLPGHATLWAVGTRAVLVWVGRRPPRARTSRHPCVAGWAKPRPSIDRSVDAADMGVRATAAGCTGGVGSLDGLCLDVVLGYWWLLPPHHFRRASAWGDRLRRFGR